MGTFLLISIRNIHSKRGKFCTFSSGLPRDQGYEFGKGQAWSCVLLAASLSHPRAQDRRVRTSEQAGSEQAGRRGGV